MFTPIVFQVDLQAIWPQAQDCVGRHKICLLQGDSSNETHIQWKNVSSIPLEYSWINLYRGWDGYVNRTVMTHNTFLETLRVLCSVDTLRCPRMGQYGCDSPPKTCDLKCSMTKQDMPLTCPFNAFQTKRLVCGAVCKTKGGSSSHLLSDYQVEPCLAWCSASSKETSDRRLNLTGSFSLHHCIAQLTFASPMSMIQIGWASLIPSKPLTEVWKQQTVWAQTHNLACIVGNIFTQFSLHESTNEPMHERMADCWPEYPEIRSFDSPSQLQNALSSSGNSKVWDDHHIDVFTIVCWLWGETLNTLGWVWVWGRRIVWVYLI